MRIDGCGQESSRISDHLLAFEDDERIEEYKLNVFSAIKMIESPTLQLCRNQKITSHQHFRESFQVHKYQQAGNTEEMS